MNEQNNKQIVMIIMDGVGLSDKTNGNAVFEARTPVLDGLMKNYAFTKLKAHGKAVGLPSDEDMGNSEVGHNAIGCGQVYAQGAKLVNESIRSGLMFRSETWTELVENSKNHSSSLHFIGLLSDGNVHSNISHLFAMLENAKAQGIQKARIHVLLDGRDVPARSALEYVSALENKLAELNANGFEAKIASGGGRMVITMDRYEADWNMVKKGWETHVLGIGRQFACAEQAIIRLREEKADIIDQDLPPFVIVENGKPVGTIEDNDSVILFNFRGDRALEITAAFENETFTKFDRQRFPCVQYAGMLQYDGDLKIPQKFLVFPPKIQNTLSEWLVKHKKHQFAVSETQKFGHVTYFWNGNRSGKFSEEYEEFLEIPSDRVSFDERPWMKAAETTDEIIRAIQSGKYDFVRANFPNGDMVGHTGNYEAVIIAVEAVDLCLQRIIQVCDECGATLIVTADHGNADDMLEKGDPKTSHSLNPVPFIIYNKDARIQIKEENFGLANIAATVADLMGIEGSSVWEESMINNLANN